MTRQPKTFFIRTYGCQMNELDSEIMAGQLEARGLTQIEDEFSADLLIYNTCSIRDLAERKVMGKLGQLGKNLQHNPIIGLAGCMANAKKDSLFHKLPHLDFVMGTNDIHHLNDILDEVITTGKQTIHASDHFHEELNYIGAKRDDKIKAYISIIRGCSKFCTYCVVPYTRGTEVSRHPDHILEECRKLVDQGYKEFMLLGQNVNSYGKDQPQWGTLFHDLLYKIDQLPGLERVRFMTSHPIDITKELMVAIRDLKTLCEFVHFPLQSGSDRILKKMHRIYTVEEYLEKVSMLKSLVPGVALGTDIIVGFPTETEEEFMETYRLLEELEFSLAFLFAYSPRKGTPAMRWKDDIPEAVKEERLNRLSQLQAGIYNKQRKEMLGTEVEVLVEAQNFKDNQLLKGRTRCNKNVLFRAEPHLIGTLQKIHIHSFTNQTLIGDLTDCLKTSGG